MRPNELKTERLRLRRWQESDREPFAALNADPVVMEFFPARLSTAESGAMVDRIEAVFEGSRIGLWAVEEAASRSFVGYAGLWQANFEAEFTPAVEVAWRLDRSYWGLGYATEAARAAIEDGFARVGLAEIVSFTAIRNRRSRRVMEKLGMSHDAREDFDHPNLPAGHPLRRHVLYRLAAPIQGKVHRGDSAAV